MGGSRARSAPPRAGRPRAGFARFPRAGLAILAGVLLPSCGGDGAGPRLYVTSGFTDEVLVLDPDDGRLLERVSMDLRPGERDEPHGVAVAPEGEHWYATLSHGEPTLWKFETAGDRLVGRVTLPGAGASRVGLSPDGSRGAVPDYWLGGLGKDGRVAVVRLHDLTLEGAPEVCPAPHDAQWNRKGTRIAVTCALSDEIVILDAGSLRPVSRFPVAAGPPPTPGNPTARPMNLVWSPDGERIYVTLMDAGTVAAFTPGGEAVWSVGVGGGPAQIAATSSGEWLVVPNRHGGTLALVHTPSRKASALPLPDAMHPHGVALHPEGTVAYVTYEGTTRSAGGVVAVDLTDGRVLWRTEAGVFTLGIAYRP